MVHRNNAKCVQWMFLLVMFAYNCHNPTTQSNITARKTRFQSSCPLCNAPIFISLSCFTCPLGVISVSPAHLFLNCHTLPLFSCAQLHFIGSSGTLFADCKLKLPHWLCQTFSLALRCLIIFPGCFPVAVALFTCQFTWLLFPYLHPLWSACFPDHRVKGKPKTVNNYVQYRGKSLDILQ